MVRKLWRLYLQTRTQLETKRQRQKNILVNVHLRACMQHAFAILRCITNPLSTLYELTIRMLIRKMLLFATTRFVKITPSDYDNVPRVMNTRYNSSVEVQFSRSTATIRVGFHDVNRSWLIYGTHGYKTDESTELGLSEDKARCVLLAFYFHD